MAEKMKKRDQIKMKNKLKVTSNFKILTYAKYLSIIIPCIVMVMLFIQSGFTMSDIQQIIMEQPAMTASFVVCIVNLMVFYQIGNILENFSNLEHIEAARMELIIIAVAQLAMANVVAFAMYLYSLYRYLRWDNFSLSASFKEIKEDRQLNNVITLFVILFLLCALDLLLVFLFQ